eukprot:TRINITY_DN2588_c0_g1_i2.p1 TRINITY_DN2588_c0_g1~~TRINITY_DN2588_c0_g1_i2.p1  ORF type:complete len:2562 (+),score=268.54 TRINITY_DN2588_c0_g1_i2:39-7724(+)
MQKAGPSELELLVSLMRQNRSKRASGIDGKDVVFLIGATGAGKTTTALYLAGCPLVSRQYTGKNGKGAQDVIECEASVPGFVIGHRSKSETKTVGSIPISSGLYACDVPGNWDTDGQLADIANAIAIRQAMNSAAKVRMVFLVDRATIEGTRGGNFAQFLKLIDDVISLQDNSSSVCILYNQFSITDTEVERLINKLDSICEASLVPDTAKLFVHDQIIVLEKARTELLIDPLAPERRAGLIERIVALKPLPRANTFRLPLLEANVLYLFSLSESLQIELLKRMDMFDLGQQTAHLIDDLHLIASEAGLEQILEVYVQVKESIKKMILSTEFKARQALDHHSFTLVAEQIELLDQIERTLGEHVDTPIESKSSILDLITSQAQAKLADIKQETHGFTSIYTPLTWLRDVKLQLSRFFVDSIPYDEACRLILNRIAEIEERLNAGLTDVDQGRQSVASGFIASAKSLTACSPSASQQFQTSASVTEEQGDLQSVDGHYRFDDLVASFAQLSELGILDVHFPQLQQFSAAKQRLNEIVRRQLAKFSADLASGAEIVSRASTIKDTYATLAAFHAGGLALYMDKELLQLLQRSSVALEKACYERIQTIQQCVSVRNFDVHSQFDQLKALMHVDERLCADIKTDSYRRMLEALYESVADLGSTVKRSLQRTFISSLEDQKRRLNDDMNAVNELRSSLALDQYLSQPCCAQMFKDAVDLIEAEIRVAHEKLSDGTWQAAHKFERLKILEECTERLSLLAHARGFCASVNDFQKDITRLIDDETQRLLSLNLLRLPICIPEFGDYARQLKRLSRCLDLLRSPAFGSELDAPVADLVQRRQEVDITLSRCLAWIEAKLAQTKIDIKDCRDELQSIAATSDGNPLEKIVLRVKAALDDLVALKELGDLAPQAGSVYDDSVSQMRSLQDKFLSDAQANASHGQLATAESLVKTLRVISTLQPHFPAADTTPLLSALVAKRKDITNDIPKLLAGKNYKPIATKLHGLDKDAVEFRDCCDLIRDHFDLLEEFKHIQCRPRDLDKFLEIMQQTYELCDLLKRAETLADFDIPIKEKLQTADKQKLQLNAEFRKRFTSAVQTNRYDVACQMLDMLAGTGTVQQLYDTLNDDWREHIKALPKKFAALLEESHIVMINRILIGLSELDQSRFPDLDVVNASEEVHKIWCDFVAAKLAAIERSVVKQDVKEAKKVIHDLTLFNEVKAMTDEMKARLRDYSEAVDCLEQNLRKVSIHEPSRLKMLLLELSQTGQAVKLLEVTERVQSEASSLTQDFEILLKQPLESKVVNGLVKILRLLSVASKPSTGAENMTTVLETFYSRINTILRSCQSSLDMQFDSIFERMIEDKRQCKWHEMHALMKQLAVAIKEMSSEFLSQERCEKIAQVTDELNAFTSSVVSSKKLLEDLDLTLAVSLDTLSDISRRLSQLQSHAALVSNLDQNGISYDDALAIVESKLRDAILSTGERIDWTKAVVVAANFKLVIDGMNAHQKLTIRAENDRRVLVDRMTQELKTIASRAAELWHDRDLFKLEKEMLLMKRIEALSLSVPEVLVERHYHTLVANVKHTISQQSSEIKKATLDPRSLSQGLVSLSEIPRVLSCIELHAHVQQEINGILAMASDKSLDFYQLSLELSQLGTIGREIVEGSTYPQFRAYLTVLMNAKTSRMSCADALLIMKDDSNNTAVDADELDKLYSKFQIFFGRYLDDWLLADSLGGLVNDIKSLRGQACPIAIDQIRKKVPELVAGISALWSILGSRTHYQQSRKKECVMRPHAIQVLTIFRILGLGIKSGLVNKARAATRGPSYSLQNHAVQVATGEGKSVILGILSALLAFLGYDVFCACYSKYLSQRDYQNFHSLFAALDVGELVTYTTLSELADKLFNEEVDVRKATDAFLHGRSYHGKRRSDTRRILLFDEVDVFFHKEFHGATYNPSTSIYHPCVNLVMEYIWKYRDNKPVLGQVFAQKAYTDLCAEYPALVQIIRNSVEMMLIDVASFASPAYEIGTDASGKKVIAYKEFGNLIPNVTYGYKTAFAYLCEAEKGVVDKRTASNFLGLKINCGQFSFAELPLLFRAGILGVTGTLVTLGQFQRNILENVYKISHRTVMPSIYGPTNLQFRKADDTYVLDDLVRYHQKILDENLTATTTDRSVLNYFEKEGLDAFAMSSYGQTLQPKLINFDEDLDNTDFYLRKATLAGQASILPDTLSRGLDFLCVDQKVEAAGGMVVIMTYLPEDLSDEVQIRGRTARQGNKGAFKVILHGPSLIEKYGIDVAELNRQRGGSTLYDFLYQTRIAYMNSKAEERTGVIDRSKALHDATLDYSDTFRRHGSPAIKEKRMAYLLRLNPEPKAVARIVCVSDATGSMKTIWTAAQVQIADMIKRINAIGGGAGLIYFKWVAYRDYDCKGHEVDASEWESDPTRLIEFVNTISCYGGGNDGGEAVELGLKAANDTPDCTRVILIGDEGPHLEGTGNEVTHHKHTLETDYLLESEKLKARGVPVYSFYMNQNPALVKSFTQISSITGGKAALFSNANTLIDVIAETTLHDLGGDDLVHQYRKTYHTK